MHVCRRDMNAAISSPVGVSHDTRAGVFQHAAALFALPDVRHIVDNYDSLAERTVFMQGKLPSCGFFLTNGTTGNHLMTNVSMEDYLIEPYHPAGAVSSAGLGGFFMPATMVVNANLTASRIRSSFAPQPVALDAEGGSVAPSKPWPTVPRPAVPRPVAHLPRGDAGDRWLPWEHSRFIDIVNAKGQGEAAPMTYADFFRKVTGRMAPPEIPFAQGAQFAASSVAIRRTPKATYQWLLAEMESGKAEIPYYLELSWLFLLGGGSESSRAANHVNLQNQAAEMTHSFEQDIQMEESKGAQEVQAEGV